MAANGDGTRILILFAHPALQASRVQRHLIRAVRDLEGITFHDLYETYPDFDVDVPREQELLLRHDLIVLQHPLYWYSVPALVKQWFDLVLEHGWAYGTDGTALQGKRMLSVISAGGREETYARDAMNRYTLAEFLAPVAQTARLCGIDYLPPFVVHGAHGLGSEEIAQAARDYRRLLVSLRDGSIDLDAARAWPRVNVDLDSILKA